MRKRTLIPIAASLVLFGVTARLMPHAPNMTPIAAIAIVSALYLDRRMALLLPIVTLILSDLAVGVYDWKIMASVYGSFALIGAMSIITTKYRNALSVGLTAIGSSVVFFLITNAAVWAFSPWYAPNLLGLLYSYELGLPFLRNMIIGDVLYTGLLVAMFETAYFFYSPKKHAAPKTDMAAV